ncbi:hypothetical protein PsorP6_004716 [Peronosclerospora sorghi]|uniref:Uncharacterized protein n=1 Tax=Peronosclerospora sorghi TaxID=230839 RepID=A0ACC0VJ24_9STRA|nr:hypothetical protein PsorP6_004716 [Peronosclerospora sorghi]
MRWLVSRVFDTYKVRRATPAAYRINANAFKYATPAAYRINANARFSTDAAPPNEQKLPSHIKFRMPDLNFKEVGNGVAEVTLTKWYVQEGAAVKDGTHMCEEPIVLLYTESRRWRSGRSIHRIFAFNLSLVTKDLSRACVREPCICYDDRLRELKILYAKNGTKNIAPGQPLAVIVSNEEDIEQLTEILTENPRCIEGYVEPKVKEAILADATETPQASSVENAASSDVLRMLNKLQKEGLFKDEKALKVLKSLARKNNEQLLTTYKASYENGVMDEAAFDKIAFIENAHELAEEARTTTSENNAN